MKILTTRTKSEENYNNFFLKNLEVKVIYLLKAVVFILSTGVYGDSQKDVKFIYLL